MYVVIRHPEGTVFAYTLLEGGVCCHHGSLFGTARFLHEHAAAAHIENQAFEDEFGLQMENLNREPDDNLGIMMGFIAHLIGLETDDKTCADMRERAVAAQKELIAGHILPWIAVWHYSTLKHARTDFFSGVGELAFGLIRAYAKRFGCTYNEEKAAFVFEG
ncbi:molecular chaperone TorD family protein [Slackia heliotrinireducens]|uniref:molecular chaperone TorD family protein n=1 Tax=Slackia heliotrinireducens TaxID=84110 RepID=UPI0033148F65